METQRKLKIAIDVQIGKEIDVGIEIGREVRIAI